MVGIVKSHQKRIDEQIAQYKDVDNINLLSDIFTYWQKTHFRDKFVQVTGCANFIEFYGIHLKRALEKSELEGKTVKKLVRKVNRVPISLMAQIQRGDLRGTNQYEKGILGTKEIKSCEGRPLDEWDVSQFYSSDMVQAYIADLVQGRRSFTEEIAGEGLRDEILYAAERSFRIDKSGVKAESPQTEPLAEEKKLVKLWESKSRPRRDGLWRNR